MITRNSTDPLQAGKATAVAAFGLIALVGCGRHGHSGKSQVVAKVNGHEITVNQLNQTLQSIDPDAVTPEVTKKAIDALIDEELLVRESENQKFDRNPSTVAAIERARRQILAQAFASQRVFPRLPVAQAEEQKYYQENPALFEHRKLYQLTVYTIKTSDMTDGMRSELNSSKSSDQVRDLLDKHGVKYQSQQVTTPAEDLPIEKLNQFASAKPGDLLIAQKPQSQVLLISVLGSEERPISFETAKPMISAFLTKKRNGQALEEHLKTQKSVAKISYVGDFVKFRTDPSK